jgi:Na+/melibiose symporter-like transporter
VSEASVQTAHAQTGIRLTASVWAAVAFFAVAFCLVFYPISRETNLKIAHELAERRKSFVPRVNA